MYLIRKLNRIAITVYQAVCPNKGARNMIFDELWFVSPESKKQKLVG